MRKQNPDIWLGAVVVALSLVAMFAWVPFDTGTAIVERIRGRMLIGDAMAPTAALAIIIAGGIVLMFEARSKMATHSLSEGNLLFLIALIGIVAITLSIMRWSGPLAVAFLTDTNEGLAAYRPLRDSAPWKWIGFFLGGSFLVTTLVSIVERRVTLRTVLIAALATAIMILAYDLPFGDLLLPPNGDVS